jgi:hypothetical protein
LNIWSLLAAVAVVDKLVVEVEPVDIELIQGLLLQLAHQLQSPSAQVGAGEIKQVLELMDLILFLAQ